MGDLFHEVGRGFILRTTESQKHFSPPTTVAIVLTTHPSKKRLTPAERCHALVATERRPERQGRPMGCKPWFVCYLSRQNCGAVLWPHTVNFVRLSSVMIYLRGCTCASSYHHHQIGSINLSYRCNIFFVVVGLTWLHCHNLSFALYRSRENIEWYMYSSGELFMRSREGYFGVYFPSCEATRETNTKITLEWAHEQFVTRVHTLFYFLHDITNP